MARKPQKSGRYRRQAKIYKLVFADSDLDGLEVKAKSVPLGTFLELTALADVSTSAGSSAEKVEEMKTLFSVFADVLVSWNLEDDDGELVPATLEGLKSQEFDFVLQILVAWMDAVAGVAAPLASRSKTGETIQEASLPMVPLSPSQESSPLPS